MPPTLLSTAELNRPYTPTSTPRAMLEMMPAKISREMPLPMPFSVMRSPIHMAMAVPADRHIAMVIRPRNALVAFAFRPMVRAIACRKARPRVT